MSTRSPFHLIALLFRGRPLGGAACLLLWFLPCAVLARPEFTLIDFIDNAKFRTIYRIQDPAQRICGSLVGVAAVRFLTDPTPPEVYAGPSVLALDAYDGRFVWKYFDTSVYKFGYNAYGVDLDRPQGIAARSDGTIYVSDTGHNRIVKLLYSNGQVTHQSAFGGPGDHESQFDMPRQISLDRHGNLYVVDSYNHRIQKFDKDGNPVRAFKSSGFIRSPEPTNCLGAFGASPGLFMVPIGVAVSYLDDSIYVADLMTSRIQKFDPSGELVRWIYTFPGLLPGAMYFRMDSDLQGRVYATDIRNNVIYVFDPNLRLLETFRGADTLPFTSLSGVAIDKSHDSQGELHSDGLLCVAEERRLSIYSIPNGPGKPHALYCYGRQGAVKIMWSQATPGSFPIAGYELHRRTPGSSFLPIAWLSHHHYEHLDDTALLGVNYEYYVVARDTQGFSGLPSIRRTGTPLPERRWRQLQAGPTHVGCAPAESLSLPLVKKWGTAGGPFPAVISDSRVFRIQGTLLYASDLRTGTLLWKTYHRGMFGAQGINVPAVQGDSVFYTTGSAVYSYNVAGTAGSSQPLMNWECVLPVLFRLKGIQDLNRPTMLRMAVDGLPRIGVTVAGGVVYVGAQAAAFAVDAATGEIKWQVLLEGVGLFDLIHPPVVADGEVAFLSTNGALSVFGVADYDVARKVPQRHVHVANLWNRAQPSIGAPTCANKMLFIPTPERILAVGLLDGEVKWT